MIKDGKIAGADLIKTVVLNGDEIERVYAAMPRTISGAWAGLTGVLESYITGTDQASGASAELVEAIDEMKAEALAMRGDFQSGAAAVIKFFANIRSEVDAAERRIEAFMGKPAYRGLLNLLEYGSGGYAARERMIEENEALLEQKRRQLGVRPGVTESWQRGATGDWSDIEPPATAEPAPTAPPATPVIIKPTGPGLNDKGKSGAEKAAEDLKRMIETDAKLIGDFERQVALFGKDRELRIEETVERLSEAATPEQRGYLAFLVDKLGELQDATDKAKEAERERERVMEEGARITEQVRTPAEQYAATLQRLNQLHAQGAIDGDTWARAIAQAAESHKKATAAAEESTLKLSDSFAGFGQVTSSAFEDAIIKGEEFSGVLNGLAEDIQRLVIRNALNQVFGIVEKQGGGWLESIVGSLFSSTSAGYGTTGSGGMSVSGGTNPGFLLGGAAHGAAFDHGNVVPFARGGVVAGPPLFPMARGAGLMGEAGPEAVVPLKRLPDGNLGVGAAGAAVTNNINVINNHPGAKVTTEERRDERGGMTLEVMIDAVEHAMAQRMSRPGTVLNRAYRGAADPVRAR